MKVGIDSNIIISDIFFKSKFADEIFKVISKCHILSISDVVIEEVLDYCILKDKTHSDESMRFAYDFIMDKHFELFEYKDNLKHIKVNIRDKKDIKILISAIEAGCDYFITGDKDFFEHKYENIKVITPRDFIENNFQYL
jgi:putative PIN family toxin of toxin-antitoxin system